MDRIFSGVYVAVLILLAFVVGALVTVAGVFPGPYIARAYEGGQAFYAKLTAYDDVYASDLWHRVRAEGEGVIVADEANMQPGLTLYTSGHDAKAVLIDEKGTVLHEWHRSYSTVWNEDAKVQDPQPDSHVYFRKAIAYPNGDLLAVYEGVGDTPYGYGVVKLDADSNVIWSYLDYTHHDVDIGADGRIYLLTHDFFTEPLEGFGNLATPRLDDFLVILSPEGEEETRMALAPLVAKSPYVHLLHTVSSYSIADPLHTNTVEVIEAENAPSFAYGDVGDVLLSFRELGAIGIVDPQAKALTWAMRGPWIGQHDPDLLSNGHLLLFDNYGHYQGEEGPSRVVEVNPQTHEIVWSYGGTSDDPLDSAIRSSQERLANGNTLITESNGGRVVEVTQAGEIVWNYLNPDRHGEGEEEKIAIICWAERLPKDYFEASFAERLGQ